MSLTELSKENVRKICQLLINFESANRKISDNFSIFQLRLTCHDLYQSINDLPLKLKLELSLPLPEQNLNNIQRRLNYVSEKTQWKFTKITFSFNDNAFSQYDIEHILDQFTDYTQFLKHNLQNLLLNFQTEDLKNYVYKTSCKIIEILANENTIVSISFKASDYYDTKKSSMENPIDTAIRSKIKSVEVKTPISIEKTIIDDLLVFCPCIKNINVKTMLTTPNNNHKIDVLTLSKFNHLKVIKIEELTDTDKFLAATNPMFPRAARLEVQFINKKNVFFGDFLSAHFPKLEYLSILHSTDNMKTYGPPLFRLSPLPHNIKTVRIHYRLMPQIHDCDDIEELCLFVGFHFNVERFKKLFAQITNRLKIVNVIFEARHSRKELLDVAVDILQQTPLLQVLSLRSASINDSNNSNGTSHKKLLRLNSRMIQTHENLKLMMIENKPVSVSRKLEQQVIRRIDALDDEFGWDIRRIHQNDA